MPVIKAVLFLVGSLKHQEAKYYVNFNTTSYILGFHKINSAGVIIILQCTAMTFKKSFQGDTSNKTVSVCQMVHR